MAKRAVEVSWEAATAATEQFNYLALFPHLAKRKPPPTRCLETMSHSLAQAALHVGAAGGLEGGRGLGAKERAREAW